MTVHQSILDGLIFRNAGPHRGGRVVAVAGHPDNPGTFYFGACAGGVWETTDAGSTWHNISDGYFATSAIGALAVAPSDPNVIYAGTGETAIRGNVSHGDGVYRSTDAGRTWTNIGLAETRHIGRIRVHPNDPDTIYVAALGNAWVPNPERGIYRTTNAGQTWELVLHKSERAGAIDLTMDPGNPQVLFASIWQAQRFPHKLESGGPDTSIWRSTDGGDTWTDITRNPGLPTGTLGKIGVAISPAKGNRVWALVESEDGAMFRSDDYGDTWTRQSEQEGLRWRAWYYMHVVADPVDADTLWVMNGALWKSIDGGASFFSVPTPHGDNHDLWIDPANTDRMIEGNDGGACVTFNGGVSWSSIYNQPTAQFYHVTADNQTPYRIYGSQQDNSAISLPHMAITGAITEADWFVPGGGESGYIAVRPDNPDIIFAGAIGSGEGNGRLTRYNRKTQAVRNITVWPHDPGFAEGAETLRYRFQWTFPIELSPHDPDVLYVASNHLHRSTDQGMSWETIAPDLTRNDPEKLTASGGPLTKDNTGAEAYCTIFAFKESPHQPGLFWVGTDDGLIKISQDHGETWTDITPPGLPEWALISIIDLSVHDAGTAYVAATRYKLGDLTPYLFKTNDYGASWTLIIGGIPDHEFTRVIREDPKQRGLLFAGTETRIYVSVDDGTNWQPLSGNFPITPVHDLIIKDDHLVVATHGRSFWILDDLSPLREATTGYVESDLHLFEPLDTDRIRIYQGFGNEPTSDFVNYRMTNPLVMAYEWKKDARGQVTEKPLNAGENPPVGVIVHYLLPDKHTEDISLTIKDGHGNIIRSFSSAEPASSSDDTPQEPRLPLESGLNRFVWDMRHAPATAVPGDAGTRDYLSGPVVVPGRYSVTMRAGDTEQTAGFTIFKDERISATQEDLEAQFELLLKIRDQLTRTNQSINDLRAVRQQVEQWIQRLGNESNGGTSLKERAEGIVSSLNEIELALIQPKAESSLQFPEGLNAKLAKLTAFVDMDDARPTKQAGEYYHWVTDQIDAHLARYRKLVMDDVNELNERIRRVGVPLIDTGR
ncbi:MAG: glycosyl hydrolase [Sphaerobacteraceae bacterium]|nr:MAG: glycosyl hydrolase [Sphaerobacteraceae bacterium]